MEIALAVIEEAVVLIRRFRNDPKVLSKQFGIIARQNCQLRK